MHVNENHTQTDMETPITELLPDQPDDEEPRRWNKSDGPEVKISLPHGEITEDVQPDATAGQPTAEALPEDAGGHWSSIPGRDMAQGYIGEPRERLGLPGHSDFELANALFLASRESIDLMVYQTAAKDRIRWLSANLYAANADNARLKAELAEARKQRDDHADESRRQQAYIENIGSALGCVAGDTPGLVISRWRDQLTALTKERDEAQKYIAFVESEVDRVNVGFKYPRATNPIHTVIGALLDVEKERDEALAALRHLVNIDPQSNPVGFHSAVENARAILERSGGTEA